MSVLLIGAVVAVVLACVAGVSVSRWRRNRARTRRIVAAFRDLADANRETDAALAAWVDAALNPGWTPQQVTEAAEPLRQRLNQHPEANDRG